MKLTKMPNDKRLAPSSAPDLKAKKPAKEDRGPATGRVCMCVCVCVCLCVCVCVLSVCVHEWCVLLVSFFFFNFIFVLGCPVAYGIWSPWARDGI